MSDRLRDHLTDIPSARLKPVNILQAAEADLRLMERKRERTADPEHHYSFASRHVRRARSAEHLIALAYYEPVRSSSKPSLHRIYEDRELLRQTLVALLNGETG